MLSVEEETSEPPVGGAGKRKRLEHRRAAIVLIGPSF
jgi:hypothetical protein